MFPTIDKRKTGIQLRKLMDDKGLSVKDVQQYKVYKEFMLYAIGRNINKYHRFLCNRIQKFEGKKEENVA